MNRLDKLKEIANELKNVEEVTVLLNMIKERDDLDIKEKRYSLYPFKHREKYERALNMAANFWSASTIDFRESLNDFNSLNKEEQQPLKRIFAFFSNLDGVAADIITTNLIQMSQCIEEISFYIHQGSNEIVHAETYSNLINDLIADKEEREKNYRAIFEYEYISEINRWIKIQIEAMEGRKRLYLTLVFMELCMFTPLFCIIFWYKVKHPGKLSEVMVSNEYISRDEALHGINGICNYNELPLEERYSNEEDIYSIFRSGMNVMENFVRNDIFKDIRLDGLDEDQVIEYTKFVVDVVLSLLGCRKLYNVSNPFPWMEMHEMIAKSNFFEKLSTDYSQISMKKAINLLERRNGTKIHVGENVYNIENVRDFIF